MVHGYESAREMKLRTKIESIRNQLPPEVSKHIVQCYDIFSNDEYDGYIMEVMRPMTKLEDKLLYGGLTGTFGAAATTKKGFDPKVDPKKPDHSKYAVAGQRDIKFSKSTDWLDSSEDDLNDPENPTFEKQKEFMSALFYLNKHFKIAWHDLHAGNVMIRPTTRDYVATDIGLFKGLG